MYDLGKMTGLEAIVLIIFGAFIVYAFGSALKILLSQPPDGSENLVDLIKWLGIVMFATAYVLVGLYLVFFWLF